MTLLAHPAVRPGTRPWVRHGGFRPPPRNILPPFRPDFPSPLPSLLIHIPPRISFPDEQRPVPFAPRDLKPPPSHPRANFSPSNLPRFGFSKRGICTHPVRQNTPETHPRFRSKNARRIHVFSRSCPPSPFSLFHSPSPKRVTFQSRRFPHTDCNNRATTSRRLNSGVSSCEHPPHPRNIHQQRLLHVPMSSPCPPLPSSPAATGRA